jgi:hypothetical protein
MSAIPPNIVSSVLQAGVAQQAQSAQQDAAENAKADAAKRTGGTPGFEDILEIEATDADGKVHTDAGGLGSQGRHDAPPEEQPDAASAKPSEGVTLDDNGQPHLDLSA